MNIDPVLSNRIKKAWNSLSVSDQNKILPLLEQSHQDASTNKISGNGVSHHLFFVKCIITDDADQVLHNFDTSLFPSLGQYGEIYGTGKYEQLDAGWIETAACWLETFVTGVANFPTSLPAPIVIPDNLIIAIAGDWGTGNWRSPVNPSPSTKIKNLIQAFTPDLTIHLGDVYYAGTHDQEVNLLVDEWPSGTLGTLTLNSNHEMYSGARNYVQDALGSKLFALQNKSNFFVLENSDWVIIGLDSAYYSDAYTMHRIGSLWLNDQGIQLDFLRQQVAKDKQVMILTHHNGLLEDGSGTTELWNQVMLPFKEKGKSGPDYWYWGHSHIGAVYHLYDDVKCRVPGHGAIPWGFASKLDKNPAIDWFENRNAQDPEVPLRVLNGMALLSLNKGNIEEMFYDENGGLAWKS